MFSKFSNKLISLGALSLGALALNACSLKIHNPPPEPQAITVSAVSAGCLSNAGSVFTKYFAGEISHNELDSFWACLNQAFKTFKDNSTGANPNYFTSTELKIFLERYFMKGQVIPDKFISEAFVLKQSMLGGNANQVTKAELDNTLQIMQVFREQSEALRPYIPFGLASLQKNKPDAKSVANAVEAIHLATEKIGHALEGSVGSYSFDHLSALLDQIDILFASQENTNNGWLTNTKELVKVLRYVKSILVAPPADAVQQSDWQKLFYLTPRYFTLVIRASYYLGGTFSINDGDGLQSLNSLVEDGYELLQIAIKNHPGSYISYTELNTLIDKLDEYHLMPVAAKPATLKTLLPIVLSQIFTPKSAKMRSDAAIISATIDTVRNDFQNWSEGQRYLEGQYKAQFGEADFKNKSFESKALLATSPEKALQWTSNKNKASLNAIKELQHEAVAIHTIIPGNSDIVSFIPGSRSSPLSFSYLSKVNLFRSINTILIRGYAEEDGILSVDDVGNLWKDVLPVLKDLKILPKDESINSGKNYALEADMFTSPANGDNNLDMDEAIELELLFTSTFQKARLVQDSISTICGVVNTPDASDETDNSKEYTKKNSPIEAKCYRETFKKNTDSYWDFLPSYAKSFRSLTDLQKDAVFANFDSLARTKVPVDQPYSTTDTFAMILIPYYIETILARYDLNSDGYIDQKEGITTYPTFRKFLTVKGHEKSPTFMNSDKDIEALFTYLLAWGHIPTESTAEMARYAWWRYLDTNLWTYKADRAQILQVLSKLLVFIQE